MRQYNDIRFPKGFTLIELLVVVAVLGIVAGGILIALNIGGVLGKANITKAKQFAASLENGLAVNQVGKWSFEEGTGATTAKDTSGYGKIGTLSGGASITDSCNNLSFGSCLTLGGNPQYVTIPDSPNLRLGKNITISTWFYAVVNPIAFARLVGKGPKFIENYGLWRFNNGDLAFAFYALFVTDPIMCWRGLGPGDILNAPLGKWTHFVGTYDGINMKVYVNGALAETCPETRDPATSSDPATIGYAGYNNYFNGLIDEVQIYNQALTLSHIQHLYAQGLLKSVLAYK